MFSRFDKFKIFDDFISKSYQNEIEEGISSHQTPWLYQPNMDYGADDYGNPSIVKFEQTTDIKYSQFVLEIFGLNKISHGPLHYAMIGLTCKIVDEFIPDYKNYRTRGILQTPIPNPPKYYIPHTDCQESQYDVWSFIYYPHDSTGDTYLFSEQVNDVTMSNRRDYIWNPIDSVSPKKGRLIMFPSRQYHAGSPPSLNRRMLLNFNFSMKTFENYV